MQLVYNALPRFSGYLKTLPPCLWKPAMLWSGKQVVSTVLLNIIPEDQDKLNLTSKAKIAPKVYHFQIHMTLFGCVAMVK